MMQLFFRANSTNLSSFFVLMESGSRITTADVFEGAGKILGMSLLFCWGLQRESSNLNAVAFLPATLFVALVLR